MDDLWNVVYDALLPASSFMAETLRIPAFVPHGPLFFVSLAGFTAAQQFALPITRTLQPDVYSKLGRKARHDWAVHVVSMIHATIVAPWALYLTLDTTAETSWDRAFGWDARVGQLAAVSSAYFVWDTIESIIDGTDVGFIVHGAACSFVYLSGYRPFAWYYGPRVLLWEISTLFLNIHWFLDKSGKTGTTFQLVNGFMLLASFFGARLVYGFIVCANFWVTMYDLRDEAPHALVLFFGICNVALYGLSCFWFTKMITALRKRFPDTNGHSQSHEAYDSVNIEGDALRVPTADDPLKLVLLANGHLKGAPMPPSLY